MKNTNEKNYILQEVIKGPEISLPLLFVDATNRGGSKPLVLAPFWNRKIVYEPGNLESGHIAARYPDDLFSSARSDTDRSGLAHILLAALKAVIEISELECATGGGPRQHDLLLQSEEGSTRPFVIDTGSRLPGMGIAEIGRKVSGLDLGRGQVQEALGLPISIREPETRCSAHLSLLGMDQREKASAIRNNSGYPGLEEIVVHPGTDPKAGGTAAIDLGREAVNRRFSNTWGSADLHGGPEIVDLFYEIGKDATRSMKPRLD